MKALASIATATLIAAFGSTAYAAPQITHVSIFAAGAAVNGTAPDSVTTGNGSVWVEYGNNADSTGAGGSSTIVQYSEKTGAIQYQYSIAGSVDGLKIDPTTGLVWALQNQDGNATLSLINPITHTVSGPLRYASPPYIYGTTSARGYDDVAFLGDRVFLSYTNPVNATDPILQELDQGHNPTGTLTTTDILTAQQTGTLPDTDSLKSTPNGSLVLTAEGDGPGSGSTGLFTLIRHPGKPSQTVTNVVVTDGMGNNIAGMDDIVFPGAAAGTMYAADTNANIVYAISLTDLDPNAPIASLGSFHELGLVDLSTGVATPLVTGADLPDATFTGPHGLDFIPEPPLVIKVNAIPSELWPPNGKMVDVTVFGTITDVGSGVKEDSGHFTVIDPNANILRSGTVRLGPHGTYVFTIALEASRRGTDRDGRTYTITVSAKDDDGNQSYSSTAVVVPHDRRHEF
ncbi:MAG TPA: hypothetical protein VGI65_17140 [Steroidobacteraceae bacterium]|jgi:hypothetical protein